MTDETAQSVSASLAEQTLTSVAAYASESDPQSARDKRAKALDAARRLVQELEDDDAAMLRRIQQVCAAQVLKFVMSLGVLDKIPENGSVTAEELSNSVGSDKETIVRMMRLLVATGDFKETGFERYAHRHTLGLKDHSRYLFHTLLMNDMLTPIIGRFPEYFKTHALEAPRSSTHNPLTWNFDMEGSPWFLAVSRSPEKARDFAIAMTGSWDATPAQGFYPFASQLAPLSRAAAASDGSRVFMCDVGGGHGADVKEIRTTNPELTGGRIVLQDLPHAFESLPPDFLPPTLGIETMVHDFFTPNPVRGAGVYYLRRILHDWADGPACTILGHVCDAMADDSVLLVADTVLPDLVPGPDGFSYWQDVLMFAIGGKERTEHDWRALFDKAGLEVVRVWRSEFRNKGIVEGRKKRA